MKSDRISLATGYWVLGTASRWYTAIGLLLFFLLCLVPNGQAQTCLPVSQGATPPWQLGTKCIFTAASTPVALGNVAGLSYFQIIFVPTGTVSAATLSLDSSATAASYSTGGIIAAASIGAMTSAGSYANSSAVTPTVFGQLTPTITGSGNVTVVVFGYINNPAPSGGVGGNSTIISPLDGSGNLKTNCEVGCAGGSTTPSDSLSNPSTAGLNFSLAGIFNGSTWERWRSAVVGNAVAATGIAASSAYCEYLTSLPTLTNGTYGAMQCDSSGRLFTDGSGVTQPTQPAGFSSLMVPFQQPVTATATALSSNSTHSFCVKALVTNGLTVYVGTSSAVTTSSGFPLEPGIVACYQASNTNLIYVIASSTGSSVAVMGE
jgi:hypothetical protein